MPTEIIDEGYLDFQVLRAKELLTMLNPERKKEGGEWIYPTRWGKKNFSGMINSILSIMYGRR